MRSVAPGSPLALVVHTTDVCHGRCVMCGIWRRPHRQAMSPSLLASLLRDDVVSGGAGYVNLTGGEPCLHPELAGFGAVLTEHLPLLREVNVSTAGSEPGLCECAIAQLRDCLHPSVRLHVTVSLDGCGDVHDTVRGVPGAFASAMETIDRCRLLADKTDGITVRANCTISKINYLHVTDVISLARSRGVEISLTLAAANKHYLGNTHWRHEFEMDASDVERFQSMAEALRQDPYLSCTDREYLRMLGEWFGSGHRSRPCIFQTAGAFIDSDGVVYPCGTAYGLSYGKHPEDSIGSSMLGRAGEAIRARLRAEFCPGCPSNSYLGLTDGMWLSSLRTSRRRP